jgi:hypothetical protein
MDKLAREVVRIKDAVSAVGRDPETLQFCAGLSFGIPDATAAEAFGHVGSIASSETSPRSAEESIELVHRYREAGFTDLVVSTSWRTPDDYRDKLQWFAENVISNVTT